MTVILAIMICKTHISKSINIANAIKAMGCFTAFSMKI